MTPRARARLLASGAAAVGLTALCLPGPVCRFAGSEPSGAALWALRVLGARDLGLALLLWTLDGEREQRLLRRTVTATQISDLVFATDLLRRAQVRRRLWGLVAGAAVGTIPFSGWPG